MSEPKPIASLSSGLLARKGTARPAMRPQGFGHFGGLEDLGWNDMGHAPAAPAVHEEPVERAPSPITALTPMHPVTEAGETELQPSPPVVEQQRAAIAASFAEPVGHELTSEDIGLEDSADVEGEDEGEARPVLATKAKKSSALEPRSDDGMDEPALAQSYSAAEFQAAETEPGESRPVQAAPIRSRVKAEQTAGAKAAFTLRLEAERHLKLRLACAVTGRSAQQLVTEALDRLLETRPEIEALADQLPAKARVPR